MTPIEWIMTFPHNPIEIAVAVIAVLWMAKLTLQSFTGGIYRA